MCECPIGEHLTPSSITTIEQLLGQGEEGRGGGGVLTGDKWEQLEIK